MDLEKIKHAKTKRIGKEVQIFETIPSTHQYAKQKAEELADGTVLLAEEQTAGIGTQNRKWYTKKGLNLAMTILLKPKIDVKKLEGFTFELAQAMKEVLWEQGKIEVSIKLPNDLMLNGKKVAGILTESSCRSGIVQNLWISIGMNINQMEFEEEIKEIATSLRKETKKEYDREDFIIPWIEKVEKLIEKR